MTFQNKNQKFNDINVGQSLYIFLFILLTLFSGPLLPEIVILFLIFFFFLIKKKIIFSSELKKIIFFFLIFYFLINISNLSIDKNILQSFKVSVFYLRFLIYIIVLRELILLDHLKTNKTLFFVFFYIFIILDGATQFYTGSNFFGLEKEGFKISGIFGDEQIMGSFLVKLLPLTLFFIFNSKIDYIKKKFIIMLIILLSLFGIVMSNEFNSIILLGIFLFFVFVLLVKFKIKYFLIICSIFLIFSQISDLSSQKNRLKGVYKNISSSDGTIINSYSSMIKTSILIWKQNKVIGSGIKSYENLSKKKEFQVSIYSEQNHPHNYYFQLLCETGLIGLSFLIYIVFISLKNFAISYINLFKKFSFDDRANISKSLLSIGLLINIFPFVPSGNFFNNWLSIIIFTYIGLLLGCVKSKLKT